MTTWNKNLNLKEAFQVSCVPAFQNLARSIGKERMSRWLKTIEYGDEDISSGIDVFWLTADGRKTALISSRDQANLLRKLLTGQMQVSKQSLIKLKELMEVKKTARSVLYGKTGTSASYDMGWFVGFLESGGSTYAFSCLLKGSKTSGPDARAAVEKILINHNFF
jgi:beta-lactamase class D